MAYAGEGYIYGNLLVPAGKAGAVPPGGPTTGISPADFNSLQSFQLDAQNAAQQADFHGYKDMTGNRPPVSPVAQGRYIASDGLLWMSENGGPYKPVSSDGNGVFDIRAYGAVAGPAGKAATTQAFADIFGLITYSYFPTVDGYRNAYIYVPITLDTGWYVDELTGYIGNPGASLQLIGEAPAGRGGIDGSVLFYDGPAGGTLIDLQALNGSCIRNITFHGNRKASKLVHSRQYWNVPNASQAGSSGVAIIDCSFHEPENEYDSIMFAAGQDDDPPNTLQTSEHRFYRCFFSGIDLGPGLTRQGWGFKALQAGNTKNFSFENCTFNQCYRGIEANSGDVFIKEINAANIGYDRGDGALFYGGANTLTIQGGAMENGNPGYAAKILLAGQGTVVDVSNFYFAGTTPGDDYVMSLNGPTTISCSDLGGNSRSSASTLAWTPSTAVLVGQERKNGGKLYRCITSGTTASSGGPTGTASDITDGTAHWAWVTSNLTGNVCKITVNPVESIGFPTLDLVNVRFPCTTTVITGVPVYDGSGNPLWASLAKDDSDYAKTVSHKLYARGIKTGIFGGDINISLPDFHGCDNIITRDQLWTNSSATGLTIVRNANGVYVVTVPYSVVVAAGAGGGVVIFDLPLKTVLTNVVLDVTTLFAGAGVSGITGEIGIQSGDTDVLLLSASLESAAQFGIDSAELGIGFTSGRYFGSWTTHQRIQFKVSASGGSVTGLTSGSATIYIESHRLGA